MTQLLSKNDVGELCFIEKVCFGADAWNENMLSGEFDCGSVFLGIREKGKLVAYICARIVFDEADINNVAVLPEFRRQGLGSKLLEGLFEFCEKQNVFKFTLEVNENKMDEKKLYEKHGFEVGGERKGYYHGENALIMWKR